MASGLARQDLESVDLTGVQLARISLSATNTEPRACPSSVTFAAPA